MKNKAAFKNTVIESIAILHILLFVYAAVSKLLDFEKFQVQLGQSPLVSFFAGFLSYFVPLSELSIAVLLAFPKFRKTALYFAYSLMVLFSAYIFIMITFSPFVPCSCGGILEKMGWETHLYFNLGFVFLGGLALFLYSCGAPFRISPGKFMLRLGALAVLNSAVIAVLFLTSDDASHRLNNFTRSFPQRPAPGNEFDLGFNSYYIAGTHPGGIYLGNQSTPLTVTELDSSLRKRAVHTIEIPPSDRRYKRITITVKKPYFYVWDGVEAFIYRGMVADWKAQIWMDQKAYFIHLVPMDNTAVAIRALGGTGNKNIIGTISVGGETKVSVNESLLTAQIDGQFDTDGSLLYNEQSKTLLYTYHYRNQYLKISADLTAIGAGRTIDTNSTAKMKVRLVASMKGSKISSPVVTVNKRTATFGNYLYIQAGLMGRFEPRDTWNTSSVIDVYNFKENRYESSFYIDDKMKRKVRDMRVQNDLLYTLQGNYLITHRLNKGL